MTDLIDRIVRDFSDNIFRLVNRIVRDRDEAKDLVQDVLVRVLCRSGKIRDESRARAYVFRAAYNAAINHRRDIARHNEAQTNMADSIERTVLPDQIEQAERREMINRAIAGLAERQREALSLRFFAEMTVPEIACVMRISEGSVKVHLSRGLLNLRATLTPALDKEEL